MNDKEKEMLIKEKEEEIKRLRKEVRELKAPRSLADLANHKMFAAMSVFDDGSVTFCETLNPSHWSCIKDLASNLFLYGEKHGDFSSGQYVVKYRPITKTLKEMSPEDIQICTRFCDEVIQLFNKYQKEINPLVVSLKGDTVDWQYDSLKKEQA